MGRDGCEVAPISDGQGVTRAGCGVDGHISFWINDHGQGREIPELRDVLGVTRPSTLVLNHLERRGGSSVIDAQGVGHLGVRGGDREISSDCEIGGCDVSEIVEP